MEINIAQVLPLEPQSESILTTFGSVTTVFIPGTNNQTLVERGHNIANYLWGNMYNEPACIVRSMAEELERLQEEVKMLRNVISKTNNEKGI